VTLDGRAVGRTPVTVTAIVGPHDLRITAYGEDWDGTVQFEERMQQTRTIDLQHRAPKIKRYRWRQYFGFDAAKDAEWNMAPPWDEPAAGPWGFGISLGPRIGPLAPSFEYRFRETRVLESTDTPALHSFGVSVLCQLFHGDVGFYGIGGYAIVHGSMDLWSTGTDSGYYRDPIAEIATVDTKGWCTARTYGAGIDIPVHKWRDPEMPGFTSLYVECVRIEESFTMGAPSDADWVLTGVVADLKTSHLQWRAGLRFYWE